MTPLVHRIRQAYGAHPLQLVLLLASFAIVGYAVQLVGLAALWDPDHWCQSIAVWFVGAALAHDLVLFPLYAAADRILVTFTARPPVPGNRPPAVPVTNYVRVPLLASGLVTLLFFPGVIRQGAGTYNRATGQTQQPFLHRWVILCAVILLLGVLAYLVARVRASRRPPPAITPLPPPPPPAGALPATRAPTPGWALLVVLVAVVVALLRGRRRSTGPSDNPG
jgi:hypothetical protein